MRHVTASCETRHSRLAQHGPPQGRIPGTVGTSAVYKASGWIHVGTTQGRGRYDRQITEWQPSRRDLWRWRLCCFAAEASRPDQATRATPGSECPVPVPVPVLPGSTVLSGIGFRLRTARGGPLRPERLQREGDRIERRLRDRRGVRRRRHRSSTSTMRRAGRSCRSTISIHGPMAGCHRCPVSRMSSATGSSRRGCSPGTDIVSIHAPRAGGDIPPDNILN